MSRRTHVYLLNILRLLCLGSDVLKAGGQTDRHADWQYNDIVRILWIQVSFVGNVVIVVILVVYVTVICLFVRPSVCFNCNSLNKDA